MTVDHSRCGGSSDSQPTSKGKGRKIKPDEDVEEGRWAKQRNMTVECKEGDGREQVGVEAGKSVHVVNKEQWSTDEIPGSRKDSPL